MKMALASIVAASGLLMVANSYRISSAPDSVIYDKDMRVIDREDLRYPPVAHTANIEGVVVIREDLDDHGKVIEALPISGAESLIPGALANAKKWSFEPNSKKTAILVYDFRIEGICHDNTESGQSIYHPPNFITVTTCGRMMEP
jgi:outer membrane biosynthesis protein TonB